MKNIYTNIKTKALSCLFMVSTVGVLSSYNTKIHGATVALEQVAGKRLDKGVEKLEEVGDDVKEKVDNLTDNAKDKMNKAAKKADHTMTKIDELVEKFSNEISIVIFLVCVICILVIWRLLFAPSPVSSKRATEG
ncbi:MAG: hypothetical protein AAF335_03430 [Bacteroidota bacterium]